MLCGTERRDSSIVFAQLLNFCNGRDFVTGFHKRKKKRRKEANRITEEKERRKRIEARKKVRSSRTRL
jgi:hypothetical protein